MLLAWDKLYKKTSYIAISICNIKNYNVWYLVLI
jgi:hypothetical protein